MAARLELRILRAVWLEAYGMTAVLAGSGRAGGLSLLGSAPAWMAGFAFPPQRLRRDEGKNGYDLEYSHCIGSR